MYAEEMRIAADNHRLPHTGTRTVAAPGISVIASGSNGGSRCASVARLGRCAHAQTPI